MHSDHSVSKLIELLQADSDSLAEDAIFQRYYSQLVERVAQRLNFRLRGAADEEDVALSAMDSFFRGVYRGQFPSLKSRDDLWNLLLTIAYRKSIRHHKRETRAKRGGGMVYHAASLTTNSDDDVPLLDQVADEPTEEEIARAAEEMTEGLVPMLRTIALSKLQGYTDKEIAEQVGKTERTIIRKRQLIQAIWQKELSE